MASALWLCPPPPESFSYKALHSKFVSLLPKIRLPEKQFSHFQDVCPGLSMANNLTMNIPLLPPSFHEVIWLSMTSCGMEYSFGHLGSAVPAVPVNCLSTSSLLAEQTECEEEDFMLCKGLSAASKALVCYQCWFSYKSRADHHMVCCEENELHPR